jgi:hypothetical protein
MKKTLTKLIWIAFVGIAGMIYTFFSHGVTSPFMSFAFVWLLIGFVLSHIITHFTTRKPKAWIHQLHQGLWLSYMFNATMGSIIIGIIEIAGSFTNLLYLQLFVGLTSLVLYLLLSILMLWSSH